MSLMIHGERRTPTGARHVRVTKDVLTGVASAALTMVPSVIVIIAGAALSAWFWIPRP